MARVARAPAVLQREGLSRTETGESREVDIEAGGGKVSLVLRTASGLTERRQKGQRVVGPFHRLELDEADLKRALGCP